MAGGGGDVLILADQDPKVGQNIRQGSQQWAEMELQAKKKYTKDLRSSSRGEGWFGGQKELGNFCRQRGLFSLPGPLYKLLHNASFLPQLRRPSI